MLRTYADGLAQGNWHDYELSVLCIGGVGRLPGHFMALRKKHALRPLADKHFAEATSPSLREIA
jgi:hypothetical protein